MTKKKRTHLKTPIQQQGGEKHPIIHFCVKSHMNPSENDPYQKIQYDNRDEDGKTSRSEAPTLLLLLGWGPNAHVTPITLDTFAFDSSFPLQSELAVESAFVSAFKYGPDSGLKSNGPWNRQK